MTALYQSPFLLALGWAIAASLWQGAVLWLLYQLTANRKTSPVFKHNMAATLLVIATGWFGYTFIGKFNDVSAVSAGSVWTETVSGPTSGLFFLQSDLLVLFNQFLPYFSAAYLIILLVLTARLTKAYLYAKRLQTTGLVAIDNMWIDRVERYTNRLGIVQQVRIYLSEYIDVPATLNYFKPVILLPVAAFNQLTPEQVESVILHEMAHIKRKDYLINILVSVMEILLFFNPFVHLLTTSLRKERENCCDDFVLQFRFDPHSYASALLSLEQMRITRLPATVLAATGNKNQLLGRVKRIMNVKGNQLNYGHRLLALLLVTFLLISAAWLAPEKHAGEVVGTEQAKTSGEKEDTPPDSSEKAAIIQSESVVTKPATPLPPESDSWSHIVPPAPAMPPVAPAISMDEEDYVDRDADESEEHVSDEVSAWVKGFSNFSAGDHFGKVLQETDKGKKVLDLLQRTFASFKDTVTISLSNQTELWEQINRTLAEAQGKAVRQREEKREIQHWQFSYDTVTTQLPQKRKLQLEQQKKMLEQRDSLRLNTPRKAKKTIWVNHIHDDEKMRYTIALEAKVGALEEALVEKAHKTAHAAQSLVAGFASGNNFVISIH